MTTYHLKSDEDELVMFIHGRGMEIKLINRSGVTLWNMVGYPRSFAHAIEAVAMNDDADAPISKGFCIRGPQPFNGSVSALGRIGDKEHYFLALIDQDRERFRPGEGTYRFRATLEQLAKLLFHLDCHWFI